MVFGVDHCAVGGMIAEKWQLNQSINDSLRHHHAPSKAREESRGLVSTVALADIFAHMLENGFPEDPGPQDGTVLPLLEKVGVNWATLSELQGRVSEEIEKARVFLQVTEKG
jgi:HD-like signal output (HDOD) protein